MRAMLIMKINKFIGYHERNFFPIETVIDSEENEHQIHGLPITSTTYVFDKEILEFDKEQLVAITPLKR